MSKAGRCTILMSVPKVGELGSLTFLSTDSINPPDDAVLCMSVDSKLQQ
jgi:hypothetical protein